MADAMTPNVAVALASGVSAALVLSKMRGTARRPPQSQPPAPGSEQRLVQLRCAHQNYAWGKGGERSLVARLMPACSSEAVDAAAKYAELWCGSTHASGPSRLHCPADPQLDGVLLTDWLKANPAMYGSMPADAKGELPFLLKVLSIGKCLSIQAHPDRTRAKQLHTEQPKVYTDDNHKPELACALTPFKAMVGFRPTAEIAASLKSTPELVELIGADVCDKFFGGAADAPRQKALLQELYSALMRKRETAAALNGQLLEKLVARLTAEKHDGRTVEDCEELALRLQEQYPNADIGVWSAFLMNYALLNPGEAVFLAAGEPHAYVEGDCVEIQACSNNTVRGGLTPKHIDVDTLLSMLTYNAGPTRYSEAVPLPGNEYCRKFSEDT